MTKKIDISVIVPVFNTRKYISRCVESILCNTSTTYEIILIDDGSTDGSDVIVDRYAKTYSNIRTIHTAHSGVSMARNIGIEASQGQWLWFVDADDWIEENAIDNLLLYLNDNGANALFWGFYEDKEGTDQYHKSPHLSLSDIPKMDINSFVLSRNPSMVFHFLFRKDIIVSKDIRFSKGVRCGEDVEFILKYLANIPEINVVKEKLYHYFIHSDSYMRKSPDYLARANDILGIIERILPYWNTLQKDIEPWMIFEFEQRYIAALIYLAQSKLTSALSRKYQSQIKNLFMVARNTGIPVSCKLKLTCLNLHLTLFLLKLKIRPW